MAPVTVQVLVVLTAVTMYDVGVPPEDPAATVTVTLPSPAAPVGAAGAPGTATDGALVATSPRITGVLESVALPAEPPHPARSITAHTTTAVALPEPLARPVKRLVRAPIANTIPLEDVVPSTCEPDEGYCRYGGSATVKTRWSRCDARRV